jgi:hypothetical protein
LLVAMGLCVDGCVSVYEPLSKRVDTWSPTEGVRHAAPLPGAYAVMTPTRFEDGRIFLVTDDLEGSASAHRLWQWDAPGERFAPAAALPTRTSPPGVDPTNQVVTFSPFGRVLVTPPRGAVPGRGMVFDHGWRAVGPMPTNLGQYWAVDLTDGGLLVVDDWETNGQWAAMLEPAATEWKAVHAPALVRGTYFTAPSGKVALLDEPSARLWDPRSGAIETLPGPSAMRENAGAVSLDEGHVLIAGGQSTDKIWNLSFLVACGVLAAWLGLGAYGTVRMFRALRAAGEQAAVRRHAIAALGAALLPGLALLLFALAALALLRSASFRAN